MVSDTRECLLVRLDILEAAGAGRMARWGAR